MTGDWLKQLASEHSPPPPGWWPPAPGWWLLAFLLALAAVLGLVAWRRPQRRRRRAALRELRQIKASGADVGGSARALENLLRRFALASFGRDHLAQVSGNAWLNFIAAHGGELLAGECGRSLLAAAFGGPARDQRDQWFAAAERFLRARPRHLPSPSP